MASSKALLAFGLLLAASLLIFSEVEAAAETHEKKTHDAGLQDYGRHPGGGGGGYPGGGGPGGGYPGGGGPGGGYPGGGGPGGGYPGGGYHGGGGYPGGGGHGGGGFPGGGRYCRWGCCHPGYSGGCRCCMHPDEIPDSQYLPDQVQN